MSVNVPTPYGTFINIIKHYQTRVSLWEDKTQLSRRLKKNILVLPKAAKLLCKLPLLDCTTTRYCSPASNL